MNGARCSSSRFSNESLNFKEFDKFGFPATCEGETSEIVYLTNFEMYMNSEDQLELLDMTQNMTYDSNDFCIETMLNVTSKSYSTVAVICEDFCANESHICVRYCCPRGEVEEPNGKCLPNPSNEDLKPKVLIEAEKKGIGKALHNYVPYCSESDRVHLNTSEVGLPLVILENGSLDLGQ